MTQQFDGGRDSSGRRLPVLPAGSYRHYKGGIYQVLGYGSDSNIPDRTVVVYIATNGESGPAISVRDVFPNEVWGDGSGFFDIVDSRTGETIPDCPFPSPDYPRRFTYVSGVRQ